MALRFDVISASNEPLGSFFLGGLDRSYVLPHKAECRVIQISAWCHNCKKFVAAESIPTLAEIDTALADLNLPPAAYKEKQLALHQYFPWPDEPAIREYMDDSR